MYTMYTHPPPRHQATVPLANSNSEHPLWTMQQVRRICGNVPQICGKVRRICGKTKVQQVR